MPQAFANWKRAGLWLAVFAWAAPGAVLAQETQIYLSRQSPPTFTPGQPIEITVNISAAGPGNITAMGVYETLPPNWTFGGLRGVTADPPSIAPAPGQTDLLEFAWITPPSFPAVFAYTLFPPESAGGVQYITGQVEYRESGGALKSNVEFTELRGPDNRPPTIQVLGENPMVVQRGSAFVDPGATASDETDGDLSNRIQRSGQVNTNQPGVYTIEYAVVDSAGNRVTAARTVEVVEAAGNGGGGTASPRPRAPAYNRDLYSGGGRPNPQRPNTPAQTAPEPAKVPESVLAAEAALAAGKIPRPAEVVHVPEGVGEAPMVTGTDRRPLDQGRLQEIVGRIARKDGAGADAAETADSDALAATTRNGGAPPAAPGDAPAQVAALPAASIPPPPMAAPVENAPRQASAAKPAPPGFAARVGARMGQMGLIDYLTLAGAAIVVLGVGAAAGYGWRSAYRGGKRRPGASAR